MVSASSAGAALAAAGLAALARALRDVPNRGDGGGDGDVSQRGGARLQRVRLPVLMFGEERMMAPPDLVVVVLRITLLLLSLSVKLVPAE